jgi:hypothetical protein
MAKQFSKDVLTSRLLEEGEHSDILDAGLSWFLPQVDSRRGKVSTPFPYLQLLMKKAGGMYNTVAEQINALGENHDPTKTMEYITWLHWLYCCSWWGTTISGKTK